MTSILLLETLTSVACLLTEIACQGNPDGRYVSSIWVQLSYYLRRCYRKSRDRKWGLLTGRDKVTWPEEAMSGSMFFACPAFSRVFFLSSSNMATGCDQRSLDPFGVPLGVRMCNRKLRNTCSDRRSRDPLEVSMGCSLRRPRPITIGNPTSYI